MLEAYADPNVPPLPPHVTREQAFAFLHSLPRDPGKGSVLVNSARQVLANWLPGHGR